MRIDWAQTLLGSPETPDDPSGFTSHLSYAMRLGRLAGMLLSILLFSVVLLVLPFSGAGVGLNHVLALSGFLLAHVVGFAMMQHGSVRDLRLPGLSNILVLPFVAMTDASGTTLFALAALLPCDFLWQTRANRGQDMAGWLLLPICLGFLAIARPSSLLESRIAGNALLPFLVLFARFRPRRLPDASVTESGRKATALLRVALERLPGRQFLCDVVGEIEPDDASASLDPGASLAEFRHSLMDEVLVVDRPPLLQALSRAVHAGETVAPFQVRLRQHDGRSFLPGFTPHLCRVIPAGDLEGRAIVILEPLADRDRAEPARETQVLHGVHEALAPFNAGLAYLEMLGEPSVNALSPDMTRHHVGNARLALREAHRNSVLMGRWIGLMQRADGAEPRLPREAGHAPRALRLTAVLNDALRALGVSQEESGLLIRGETEVLIDMDEDAARFAMMVLLRGVLSGSGPVTGLRLDLAASAQGLRLSIEGEYEADPFQVALEEAATRLAACRFEHAPTHMALKLPAPHACRGEPRPVAAIPARAEGLRHAS